MVVAVVISLVVGALGTSYVEYRLNYNLVDKVVDLVRRVI